MGKEEPIMLKRYSQLSRDEIILEMECILDALQDSTDVVVESVVEKFDILLHYLKEA